MRIRLIIPVAVAAAATYAALVRDEQQPAEVALGEAMPTLPYEPPSDEPVRPHAIEPEPTGAPAPAPAPAAQPARDAVPSPQSTVLTGRSVYDLLAGEPPVDAPPARQPEPEPLDSRDQRTPAAPPLAEVQEATGASVTPLRPEPAPAGEGATVLDEGRFALGGWAAAAGHSVVSAVTYHHRLPVAVPADHVEIHIEAGENIPDIGGLVVLSDPGFAPDHEGFTLLLSAADPGPFSAAGSYRVLG